VPYSHSILSAGHPPQLAPSAVRVALDARDQLGESPWWDADAGELVRADIVRGRVHGWAPAGGASWSFELDGEVGAVVPRAGGGQLIALDRTLRLRDADGTLRELAHVERDLPDNRFNDCRADPQGRLWAGTMSKLRAPGTAALYRLAPGGEIERVVAGTTISNGLGWSPQGDRMYFVDSTTQRIDALDFDGATGAISERRPLATIDPADGLPDGLAVDAEGGVWLSLFGGGAIRRYDADGTLDAVVPLPVTNPTCPAFGGPDLATLYVTSARHRLTPEQLAAEPLAGALLALEPGVRGLPANRFAG
jgi:sugar lactone lactonase YvrE